MRPRELPALNGRDDNESVVFIMAALAHMEHEIKSERVSKSISKRRVVGKNLGDWPVRVTDSQIRIAMRLVDDGEPTAQVAEYLGMSRAIFYRRSRALVD